MTRSVWLKADDAVGDWEARKRRITAGLEAGVDWVLVDESDVARVRELGAVNVAAFAGDDVHVMDAEESDSADPDAIVVGKDGEGDGTVDLPTDYAGSADLTTLRRTRAPPAPSTPTSGRRAATRGTSRSCPPATRCWSSTPTATPGRPSSAA